MCFKTIKIKAWNASKTHCIRFAHGASLSPAIAKFHNAEIDCFGHKLVAHELISGSLGMTIGQHGIGDLDESRDVGTGKIVNPIILLAKFDTAVMDFQHDILQ